MEHYIRKRGMSFGRAAMRYYPDLGYQAAVRRFRREIRETIGLLDALKALGYEEHHRYLTPQEMSLIANFLGVPD